MWSFKKALVSLEEEEAIELGLSGSEHQDIRILVRTIIFFLALMSVMYFLGIMGKIVNSLVESYWAMGTSGTESLSAASTFS